MGWLGKAKAALGVTGYPMVELMTLVETGTRGLIGAVFGPTAQTETGYASALLHLLTADMLVLADRGFDHGVFLEKIQATGAMFVIRLKSSRRPPIACLWFFRIGVRGVQRRASWRSPPAPAW